MKQAAHAVAALLLLSLIAGCAAVSRDCDPTTGGFLGAVGCDVQGRYDQRIQEREDEASSLMVRKAALIEKRNEFDAQQRSLEKQLQVKQTSLARSREQLRVVTKRLDAELTVNDELEAQRRALQAEVSSSERAIADLRQAEVSRKKELASLQGEMRTLERETEAALGP